MTYSISLAQTPPTEMPLVKNETFLQKFIASVKAQGGSITRVEALEHMEGNPIDVLHETLKQFAKGWIDGYDDGSDDLLTHPARYGAS